MSKKNCCIGFCLSLLLAATSFTHTANSQNDKARNIVRKVISKVFLIKEKPEIEKVTVSGDTITAFNIKWKFPARTLTYGRLVIKNYRALAIGEYGVDEANATDIVVKAQAPAESNFPFELILSRVVYSGIRWNEKKQTVRIDKGVLTGGKVVSSVIGSPDFSKTKVEMTGIGVSELDKINSYVFLSGQPIAKDSISQLIRFYKNVSYGRVVVTGLPDFDNGHKIGELSVVDMKKGIISEVAVRNYVSHLWASRGVPARFREISIKDLNVTRLLKLLQSFSLSLKPDSNTVDEASAYQYLTGISFKGAVMQGGIERVAGDYSVSWSQFVGHMPTSISSQSEYSVSFLEARSMGKEFDEFLKRLGLESFQFKFKNELKIKWREGSNKIVINVLSDVEKVGNLKVGVSIGGLTKKILLEEDFKKFLAALSDLVIESVSVEFKDNGVVKALPDQWKKVWSVRSTEFAANPVFAPHVASFNKFISIPGGRIKFMMTPKKPLKIGPVYANGVLSPSMFLQLYDVRGLLQPLSDVGMVTHLYDIKSEASR